MGNGNDSVVVGGYWQLSVLSADLGNGHLSEVVS